jgi:HD-GYP domain-containing protein (c-di-GMP phosphodiesterase class II)
VGKIHVPDALLNKPGRLTDEEFPPMQEHTTAGSEIITRAMSLVSEESGYLDEARNLAEYHHEKWDGSGYPMHLSGEQIPLSARIMAVADVFDALVSRRSYKQPFSIEDALQIIRDGMGTHFDPQVAQAFLNAEPEVRRIAKMNMEL